jgi:small subunit ribosomal protein S16
MSVKIRLAKTGKKHQISYRIAAQDTRSKRDGKFLEILGYYNPFNKPALKVDNERVSFWQKNGATLTQAVKNLLTEGKLTKKASKRKLKLAQEAKAAKDAQNQPTAEAQTPSPTQPEEQAQTGTKPENPETAKEEPPAPATGENKQSEPETADKDEKEPETKTKE